MKKRLLKALCISGVGITFSAILYKKLNTKCQKTYDKRKIKTIEINNNFDEIFIKDGSVPINLLKSIDDSIHITFFENEEYFYDISRNPEKSNQLLIEFKRNVSFLKEFLFRRIDKEYYLEVCVPDDLYAQIKGINNSIYVDGVKVSGINVKNINGKIEIVNTKSTDEIDIKNTNSSINVKNIKCNDLFVNNSNGKMSLDNIDVDGAIKIKNTNGSIILQNTDFQNSSSITTINGKINVGLKGSEDEYSFNVNVANGKIYLNGDEVLEVSKSEIGKILEIKSTNGKINISTT